MEKLTALTIVMDVVGLGIDLVTNPLSTNTIIDGEDLILDSVEVVTHKFFPKYSEDVDSVVEIIRTVSQHPSGWVELIRDIKDHKQGFELINLLKTKILTYSEEVQDFGNKLIDSLGDHDKRREFVSQIKSGSDDTISLVGHILNLGGIDFSLLQENVDEFQRFLGRHNKVSIKVQEMHSNLAESTRIWPNSPI